MSFFRNVKIGVISLAALFAGFGAFFATDTLLAQDLSPPKISNIQLVEVGDNSATIRWETDEEADSLINYGLSSDYGIERDPLADKLEHEITIDGLRSSTQYHFRVTSADEFGNQNVSGDFKLITSGFEDIEDIEVVQEIEQQAIVGQVFELLDEVTDPEVLKLISDKVVAVQATLIKPPSIIGTPIIEELGTDFAVVRWATDRDSNSMISFAPEETFLRTGEYVLTQGKPNEFVKDHEVRLVGFDPSTTYHFSASSEDKFGLVSQSEDDSFTTKSILPTLQDVQLLKIEETSATFVWTTDVPAAGTIEFTDLDTGETRSQGSPELLTSRTVRIADLTLGTTYEAIIISENASGDTSVSEPVTFTTVRDREPPIISKVNNESTLFPGSEARIQTIVSWATDEPSFCQMFYRQGLQAGSDPFSRPLPENPKEEHVEVVVEFLPSTVYQFWVECEDRTGNTARSEDFVLFTPEKEKSIIDIILENFEGSFGWVKNIGG